MSKGGIWANNSRAEWPIVVANKKDNHTRRDPYRARYYSCCWPEQPLTHHFDNKWSWAQPHKKRPIFKHGLHLIRRVKCNICQEIITKKKVHKETSLRLSQILNQNIKKHKSKFPSKLFLKKFRKLSRTTHQITTP